MALFLILANDPNGMRTQTRIQQSSAIVLADRWLGEGLMNVRIQDWTGRSYSVAEMRSRYRLQRCAIKRG